SPSLSRMNRAAVKVTFDNSKRLLDLDFKEVVVERVVHRDGQNEYLLNGSLPYLELPGTGADDDARGGRPYTIGRFKGRSFYSNELEYRYPLTQNKLLSGIAFVNAQTGSNQQNINLFQRWNSGGGLGLRLLLNKYTRSNICIDYGIGNYGARGLFIALNETF
ncbi:MAG: hypothetical protein V4577_11455, partial [Bacteroidota bacterium]